MKKFREFIIIRDEGASWPTSKELEFSYTSTGGFFWYSLSRIDKLILNFQEEDIELKGDELIKFKQTVDQIVNQFFTYRIGIEYTPAGGILFTLIKNSIKIHIETFLGEDVFEEYVFSIFDKRQYLINGIGSFENVIIEIKNFLYDMKLPIVNLLDWTDIYSCDHGTGSIYLTNPDLRTALPE